MAIAIPSYGTPGFIYNEDNYIGFDGVDKKETNAQYPQEVVITCPHKFGRVCGVLNGGLTIDGTSEWTEMMGGGIMSLSGSLIDTANNILQFAKGSSVQQPWMNRKMWKTTKPFSFTLPMSFVATTDPINDVIRPVMALQSFLHPRKVSTNGGKNADAYTLIDEASKGKISGAAGNKAVITQDRTVGQALSSIGVYNIPGPAIRYTGNPNGSDDIGDPVMVVVGKIFAFGSCYLEQCSVKMSDSMDTDGLPIAADVTLKVTVMDSGVCETNGDFMIQEFSDASVALGGFIDKFSETIVDLASNLANMFDKGIGFWKDAFK